MNRDLVKQLQSVHDLFKRTGAACGEDIELMSHWARYLCIVCAGFLESALIGVYAEYCRTTANEHVANFATRALKQYSNPQTGRFLEVAGNFRTDWRAELEKFVGVDGRKEAIDSIMANRHLIAHGRSCEITVARLREYFVKAVDVVEFIVSQCNVRKS